MVFYDKGTNGMTRVRMTHITAFQSSSLVLRVGLVLRLLQGKNAR